MKGGTCQILARKNFELHTSQVFWGLYSLYFYKKLMHLNVKYSRTHPAEWPYRLSILLAREVRVIYGKIPSTKGEAMGAVDGFFSCLCFVTRNLSESFCLFSVSSISSPVTGFALSHLKCLQLCFDFQEALNTQAYGYRFWHTVGREKTDLFSIWVSRSP